MKRKRAVLPLMIKHSVNGQLVRAHQVRGKQLILGSTRNAHIRLLSKDISGVSCVVERQEDVWTIYDLGSQPDVKIDGKPFVEHKIVSKCTLQIANITLEFEPTQRRREMFTKPLEALKGPSQKLTIIKWKGRVVETTLGPSHFDVPATSGDSGALEVIKIDVPIMQQVEREKISLDPALKRPLIGTFLTVFIFLAVLFGIPTPQEQTKPKDNVYTRMIFDSKVLAQKKKQLASFGVKSFRGTGNGNGAVSEGAKGQSSTATKAVTSLRKAGLQSLISKIAGRASQSAKMIATMAAMPSANANTPPSEMGSINAMPSSGAAAGKTGLAGNNKGFKINGIGTGGKGGGSGSYKDGSALGTGSVGNGEVAVEDTESVVEGGLDREVIAGVIKDHLGQIRYCYERQLAANADLYGKIKVKFSIDANGLVDSQTVGQSTLKSAMVEDCILRRIATWKFPKPKGGTKVLVSYPFLFKSVN